MEEEVEKKVRYRQAPRVQRRHDIFTAGQWETVRQNCRADQSGKRHVCMEWESVEVANILLIKQKSLLRKYRLNLVGIIQTKVYRQVLHFPKSHDPPSSGRRKKKQTHTHTMSLPRRTVSISRITNETKIQVSLSLDGGALLPFEESDHFPIPESPQDQAAAKRGVIPDKDAPHATQFTSSQQITINTGIGFLDHMLHALAKHAGWSLAIRAKGDLYSTGHPFC